MNIPIKYLVDGIITFTRRDFEDFLIQRIYEDNESSETLIHLLPTTTIERNVRHHPLRLAREMGIDVEYIR